MILASLRREKAAGWSEDSASPAVPTTDDAAERKQRAFEIEALPHLASLYRVALGFAGDPVRAEPPQRFRAEARRLGLGPDRAWILSVGETRQW